MGYVDVTKNFSATVNDLFSMYDASQRRIVKLDYLPNHVSIEPTNLCNLKCIHCHQSDKGTTSATGKGFMDMAVYKKLIDEIRHYAHQITLNVHGEPLLHKNILDMVKYAKQAGLSVSLLTNGTLLKKELTHSLIEMQLDRIVFSFEGSTEELHRKVRYGSNYKRTLSNIIYFMLHNQKYGKPPTFICMSMVDGPHTHHDCDAYKGYFSKFPINTVFLSKALNFSESTEFGKQVEISENVNKPLCEQVACRVPWEVVTICWDGSVSACPIDHAESHIVGNIKMEELKTIWNSDRMQKFRQCHLDRDFEWIEEQGPLCARCNARLDDPEYNFFNLKDAVVNSIVRKAKVFGQQLFMADTSQEFVDITEKIHFAEDELKRVLEK